MYVEIAIRYSDDWPCTVTMTKPGSGVALHQIVTPRVGVPQSVAEGLREARWLFRAEPWTGNKPHQEMPR